MIRSTLHLASMGARVVVLVLTLLLVVVGTAEAAAPPSAQVSWEETLDRVSRAVVAIRVTATRDFDTEGASVSQGTGFVVDAERGILLTNRHMVHAGPVLAEGILLNHEEIELWPVYRDPVHDFGFYRFDPAAIRHMKIEELKLAPEAAHVGTDIRVVGNDAGEKLSILDGTLARLDRNAPAYGGNSYNDFNTFYLQAASNTSGGSSGSPVVDREGRVVALNAGGNTGAASSFYLPLDRVVRALDLLRRDEAIGRGTLQTVFVYTPYDEIRRLGLQEATESAARASGGHGTGMLVVRQVVPEGPAAGKLEVGDVLVRVDGELVTEFVPLEARLDARVGQPVAVEVERGGKAMRVELTVGDLHAITPDRYVEVGRGILHTLSYHQARNHNRAVRGVYLAAPGYMWAAGQVPGGAVLREIDGVPVPDLDTALAELERKAQGQRIRVRFDMVDDEKHAYEAIVVMDRRWYPMRSCHRDDVHGEWPCVDAPEPPAPQPQAPASELLEDAGSRLALKLAPSLVLVDYDIPHPTAGVKDFNYVGVGVVVDAERGLVVVDRDTVPVSLGDLMITFAGTVRVPARLRYLHPIHNYAVLAYDPALLGDLDVQAISWSKAELEPGDAIWQVGRDSEHALVDKKAEVLYYEHRWIGLSDTPRYRDSNLVVIDPSESKSSLGGVLTDRRGRVHALWASFLDQASDQRSYHGLPRQYLEPVVGALRRGEEPVVRSIGADLTTRPLADARERGLSDEQVRVLMEEDPEQRVAVEVHRVHGGSPAMSVLRDTDLLLAIDGEPLTSMLQVLDAEQRERLRVTVLRDGKTIDLDLDTQPLDGVGVDRVVTWAGLVLHAPHREVAAQQGTEAKGVYIAWLWYGTPGARYGLRPTRRIVQVDDTPVANLDDFLAAVQGKPDHAPVRLTMEALDGSVKVATLRIDLKYWPTQVFELEGGEWTRRTLPEPVEAGR